MDVDAAHAELALAVRTAAGDSAGARVRATQAVLINRGVEALGLSPNHPLSFNDLLRIATEAPPTPGRREFAVLLVHALGIQGMLPTRGETEIHIRLFLERALLNPLRRAGYPFDGTAYEKRQAFAGLHVRIDEHLRPLEPSIPRWLHGLRQD